MDNEALIVRLAAAEQAIAKLTSNVEELRRDVANAAGHMDLTMRGQLRCRACGGRTIFHAREILDRANGGAREAMAVRQPSMWRSRVEGALEAFICMGCGAVEWYADKPSELTADGDTYRILDGETTTPPYR